jgi:hypothetical protein
MKPRVSALVIAAVVTACGGPTETLVRVDPVVSVTMTVQRFQSGACPQPPGFPRSCPTDLVVEAAFLETAGASAVLENPMVEVLCGADRAPCRTLLPTATGTSHPIKPGQRIVLTFRYLYTNPVPSAGVLRTTIVGPVTRVPLEATF